MAPERIGLQIIIAALLIGIFGCTTAPKDQWKNPRQVSVFKTKEEIPVNKMTRGQVVILEFKENISVDIYTGDAANIVRNLRTNQLAIEFIDIESLLGKGIASVKGRLLEAYDYSTNSFLRNRDKDHIVVVSLENIMYTWKGELRTMASEAETRGTLKSWRYYYDRGDYETAVELLKTMAESGDTVVQHNLGVMYANGDDVPLDHSEAFKWYSRAAESGYGPSQVNLGLMYAAGTGVEVNHRIARSWYMKAAEQIIPQAQYLLGVQSFEGEGVIQDYNEAEQWFRRAASQSLAEAQYFLGRIYWKGLGVTPDYEVAAQWYRLAAKQGERRAQMLLGVMYFDGQGVNQDTDKAIKWLTLAAEQGVAHSYYLLGIIYEGRLEYGRAISDLGKAIMLDPGHVKALNSLAWIQSTAKNRRYRSGKEAVLNAERAVSLTNRENAMILETLAAAFAEDGQYEKAEETIREAISKLDSAEKTEFEEEFTKALRSYERGQKYY